MSAGRQEPILLRVVGGALIGGLLLFLFLPLIVVGGASLSSGERPYVSFPPVGLSFYWYSHIPSHYWRALLLSIMLAIGTATVCSIIAIPIALGLVRARFFGKQFVAILLRAPLQIPYIVTGIAFLQLYYLISALTGVQLRATYWGLLLGHVFLSTPYAIASVTAVLIRFNSRLEEAAASLGAGPWRVFRRVTLPVVLPGVYSGALYAFIISFGEVPVSLFIGGSGHTTLPVEIFSSMQFDFGPALLSISTVVLLISFVALVIIQRIIGLDTAMRPNSTR